MPDPLSPSDTRTDAQLIAAINAGDAAAFGVLYARYRDWVTALAYRTTRDRDLALDVAQETFLYFLRQFPGFTLTAQLKTFLYPVVRHTSVRALQKARRFQGGEQELDALPAAPDSSPGTGDAGEARTEMAALLRDLPAGQQEVLILRFVDGLSLQEIATALGVPLGTVKSRMHVALAALRRDSGKAHG